ncbi:MAG: TIGR03905 family TSCPD domain-containing protein [Solobacterium sp.]|nr:TIGR03905 family TSCPD domain-containing protein [Solobacterium sp.]
MREQYTYKPTGVCSKEMIFELEDGVIQDLQVIGGCNGNLKGISALVKGQMIQDVVNRLEGIQCGIKQTSCPDQIAKALKSYMTSH